MASEIRVNQIQSRTGVSTISFTETGPIISGVTTITGDLDVTGLVSYDDVTNIDSVGVITARDGLHVTGGSVGIGTDNPTESKIVIGHTQTSTVKHLTFKDSTNNWVRKLGVDSSNNFGIFSGDTEHLRINPGGDVNITGITTASQFDATSDVALKENIEVIDEPITKLSELKGVTFDWKKGGHSVGVIAQDVEKVLPTAVGGSKDQKTVNYNAIIGLLVESVKDQQKQIEELKSLLDK